MHIAVVGCSHGEVDKIYEVIEGIEQRRNIKVDLLLCCGDFQSVRNMTDLRCMACPIKYQAMHDFHRYYSGEKKAPVLTLFIGGNHEASNFLQELPHGGWVAPNIYYCGYASALKFGPLKIAALSGIYKGHDYLKGRHEVPPYNQSTIRSVYHYRNLDVFRLKQMKEHVDIILSHDWPKGIHEYGEVHELLRKKPFFRQEIQQNELGSKPLMEILNTLQPSYWFSAHLHVKFAAIVPHTTPTESQPSASLTGESKPENSSSIEGESTEESACKPIEAPKTDVQEKMTRFLALDKVLPRRQFLQIIEIPTPEDSNSKDFKLQYDPEWLAILKSTNKLVSVKDGICFMPNHTGVGRFNYTPTPEEIAEVSESFGGNFDVPLNFTRTAPVFFEGQRPNPRPAPVMNPQTTELCNKLGVVDPLRLLAPDASGPPSSESEMMDVMGESSYSSQLDITYNENSFSQVSINPDEITFDDDDEEEEEESTASASGGSEPVNIQSLVEKSAPSSSRSKLLLPPPKHDDSTFIAEQFGLVNQVIEDDDEELQSLLALRNEIQKGGNTQDTPSKPTDLNLDDGGQPFFVLDSKGSLEGQMDEDDELKGGRRRQFPDNMDDGPKPKRGNL